VLRSVPKVVFLYPTLIVAVAAAISMTIWEDHSVGWTRVFLVSLFVNLVVITFDFPRTTSLTALFLGVAAVVTALLINERRSFLPAVADFSRDIDPSANTQFYVIFAVGVVLIYLVVVFLDMRFDYWEVYPNELIHHHGILGNVSRYPAPGLEMQKEITDVFEWLLFRSGRLIIHPSRGPAVVLENVPNINRREAEIKTLLDALSVEVTHHNHVGSDFA
jgi:hypothetical protein